MPATGNGEVGNEGVRKVGGMMGVFREDEVTDGVMLQVVWKSEA